MSTSAQQVGFGAESWGQTYRPAGLINLEARVRDYPWVRAEAQVWGGESPLASQGHADVVVLAVHVREPGGHGELRGGRFILTTGAVRPVHLDGLHARGMIDAGTALEVFGGVPVSPRFAPRAYDWLAGARVSQRMGRRGAVGASFVERRDHGALIDRELGGDVVLYLPRRLSLSGRSSFDLVSRGLSEVHVSGAWGSIARRLELFGLMRNPSLVLSATSLFTVLSNVPSSQAGMSGQLRVAPRLRLRALLAYRAAAEQRGARGQVGATLWLDDEGAGALEGELTRDGVRGSAWTGLRALLYRDVWGQLRIGSELELVLPDAADGAGRVWPWGRFSGRYTVREHWHLSAGVEAAASPQFVHLVQGLLRVGYEGGAL